MGHVLMTYMNELIKAMDILAKDDRIIFLGQQLTYYNHVYGTTINISKEKMIELPIMEDTQMGMSIGLALSGYIPVSIYPRMDFIILAMNQLVNHLDKIEEMSKGVFKPKVIIRTIVGSKKPLNPGLQHSQNHTEMLKKCLTNIDIIELEKKEEIVDSYVQALNNDKSTLLIERRDLYDK